MVNHAAFGGDAASQLQTQLQALAGAVQPQLQNLPITASSQEAATFAAIVQQVQPQEIAGSQAGAFQSVFTYIDAVHAALGDNEVSAAEMQAIVQAGANAVAGLNAHGGAQFASLESALNEVTNAIAGGDLATARQGLYEVETHMPARDSLSGPGIAGSGGGREPGRRRP